MAKGSFGRTVARAAASGGSRGYRARSPRSWYLLLFVIVVAGVGLIAYSRYERMHPATAANGPPPHTGDHWYAALAIDVCGKIQPNLAAQPNLSSVGIRTFGDGIIDINPSAAKTPANFEGVKATLATFVANYPGLVLTSSALGLPTAAATAPSTTTSTSTTTTTTSTTTTSSSSSSSTSSSTTTTAASTTTTLALTKPLLLAGASCSAKLGPLHGKAVLEIKTWSSPNATGALTTASPSALKLSNGEMLTVAFVPAGSVIPEPPSRATLVSDLGSAVSSASTTTVGPTTSSVATGSSTTTTLKKKK